MSDLSRSVLTLNYLIRLQGEEVRKRGEEDGKVRTLMNLEDTDEFSGLEDYTALRRPKYPPFRGVD